MKDMERLLKEIKLIKSDLYASSDFHCLNGKELYFQLLQMECDILLSLRDGGEVKEIVLNKIEVEKEDIRACSICRNLRKAFRFKVSDNKFGFICQECFLLDPKTWDDAKW